MKYCALCNHDYSDATLYCESCGNQLEIKSAGVSRPAACPKCATMVQDQWKFCKVCGYSFIGIAGGQPQNPLSVQTRVIAVAPPTSPVMTSSDDAGIPVTASLHEKQYDTPTDSGRRKRLAKKIFFAISIILCGLIIVVCAAAAGWYALGIRITVQTDPGESKVVIDGQEVGTTNHYGSLTTPRIRAGEHTVVVIREGYDTWKQSFSIAFTDFSKGLNVKLNATKYKLTIVSSPAGSKVLVDDNSRGNTSASDGGLEIGALTPGEHTVIVRHDGYRDWKQSVQLSADQRIEVTLNSAPVADANSYSADSEIRNMLEGWAQSTRNRDVDGHLRYYADTLDYYYNRTLVPSSKVREDRVKAFARFNSLSVQLSNISVQIDTTGQRATVVLDKTFDFHGDNNAFYKGSVQDQLTLTKLGGAWLITGEKELKVYYVNK